jgi:hypothetical protein
MGFLFHRFWISKPICVSVWAYQVGLLTPVQAAHGDQPQFRPGSLKSLEIFISIVWRVALLNALPLNLMKSLTFQNSVFNQILQIFSRFVSNSAAYFTSKGRGQKIDFCL